MKEAGANLPERLSKIGNSPAQLTSNDLEVDRLVSVYLRTLTSPQTIKTYNTEIHMFLGFMGEKLRRRLG